VRPRPEAWARWRAGGRPWTVGVEEEVVLIDAHGVAAANRVADVLATASAPLADRLSAETHACVVEIKTAPAMTVAAAGAELFALRLALDGLLRARLELRAVGVGTHPLLDRSSVRLAPLPRYRQIGETMRAIAQREPTMALHVHVAVPDAEAAVRALNGLRDDLPLLLGLSANSPFVAGRDTGFASVRAPMLTMFPRMGLPRRFAGYEDWLATIRALVGSGAIPDPSFVWWDIRLQPQLGTVELRVLDAQSRVADTTALVALAQCLVRLHAEAGEPADDELPEVLAENRFLAARDGVRARLVGRDRSRVPLVQVLTARLAACRPVAEELGCDRELRGVLRLARDPGDERQRMGARRSGLASVVETLARDFAPAPRAAVAG
jgi:carboxylate-amine ligase